MANFEILDGSAGLRTEDVAHVIVPGRGRNESGDGLSLQSLERVSFAARFFVDQTLENYGGVIIPSGYKTPAEKNGEAWTAIDEKRGTYRGIPEAESMRSVLLSHGISASAISAERDSFDTATNFLYAENGGHFPDDRPVAIVAQERHLERMIKVVAPKTLHREFLGVVVPEGSDKDGDGLGAKVEGIFAEIESRFVLAGTNPNSNWLIRKSIVWRGRTVWSIAGLLPLNKF